MKKSNEVKIETLSNILLAKSYTESNVQKLFKASLNEDEYKLMLMHVLYKSSDKQLDETMRDSLINDTIKNYTQMRFLDYK